MNYRKSFKRYLDDLGRKKPSPGGGSAVSLSFCLGVSLVEKALNYSLDKDNKLKTPAADFCGKKLLAAAHKLRRDVYAYIDLDGRIFENILNAKGTKRRLFLKQSEKIMISTARHCLNLFSLAKKVESGIKKSIISDFNIGCKLAAVTLEGCIINLEANARIFGKKSKDIGGFKKVLEKWA